MNFKRVLAKINIWLDSWSKSDVREVKTVDAIQSEGRSQASRS